MSRSTSTKAPLNLDDLVLAYIVRTQGKGSSDSLNRLREYYEKHEGALTDSALDEALMHGLERFNQGQAHLYICNGLPCRNKNQMVFSPNTLKIGGCLTTLTECQGPCKQAPVATLRVDQEFQIFSQVALSDHWKHVFKFAKAAAGSQSLEIDSTQVQPFIFDPEKDIQKPDVNLIGMDYLIGAFSGEGRYVDGRPGFLKSVKGTWEAGGRFVSLSMEANYQTNEGKTDTHRALVMVGAGTQPNEPSAWIFSDSGQVLQKDVKIEDKELFFEDRVPGGLETDARARKKLKPVSDGFLETLEVAKGNGDYEEYSNVHLKKHETRN